MAGKTGFLYVFDRVTGEPIWPIEERPVPKSDDAGRSRPGRRSPSRPIPPPFAKQTFTEDDINPYGNVTDAAREAFKERLRHATTSACSRRFPRRHPAHSRKQRRRAFGTTAAGPDGSVYVITQDNPAILRLLREGENVGRGGGAGAAAAVLPGAASMPPIARSATDPIASAAEKDPHCSIWRDGSTRMRSVRS